MFKVYWQSKSNKEKQLKSKEFKTKEQAEFFKQAFEETMGSEEFTITPFIIGSEQNNIIQFKLNVEIK